MMYKNALTLAEILVAMTLIAVLAIISINSLKIFVKDDVELLKFKQVFGSVSEVAFELITDADMYPTKRGFADTKRGQYLEDEKVYEGPSKFRKLFKSKFNIKDNEVKFNKGNSIGLVPVYTYFEDNDPQKLKTRYVDFSELYCFTENKGITYCLYDTCSDVKTDKDACIKNNLSEIYIRAYLTPVKTDKVITFDHPKAIYFTIDKLGKLSIPSRIHTDTTIIFDCGLKDGNAEKYYKSCMETKGESSVTCEKFKHLKAYREFYQCRARANSHNFEFHSNTRSGTFVRESSFK